MITREKLIELLESKWGLKNPIIKNVYNNESGIPAENVWYVNEEYVMKAGKNIEGLKYHIEISKALQHSGLNAPVPIAADSGENYISEKGCYFCLMKRVEGRPIRDGECYEGNYESKGKYIGEIIGRLHLALRDFTCGIELKEPDMFENVVSWAIPEVRKVMQLPEAFYEDYTQSFRRLYPDLPKQIIHRDPHPKNILFENGRLTGFIDFELSECNIRLFDPCYTSTALLSEAFEQNSQEMMEQWIMIFRNIIAGYDSINRLSEDEKKAIPYVIDTIEMVFIAYCANNKKLTQLMQTNIRMLEWLIRNREPIFKLC